MSGCAKGRVLQAHQVLEVRVGRVELGLRQPDRVGVPQLLRDGHRLPRLRPLAAGRADALPDLRQALLLLLRHANYLRTWVEFGAGKPSCAPDYRGPRGGALRRKAAC